MKKNVLIILLSIFVLSCNSNDDNPEMTKIEFTTISKSSLKGNGKEGIIQQNLVITNQNSLNDLITKMNSINNVSYPFLETDIDFSKHKIIAVFDKIMPNGGYSLDLEIISNSENVIVRNTRLVSEEGGNATTVITQPFHIVKIPNSDLPIIFE
ncbi:protease complex subunit PrcB family protein [Tenacibaculum salmonis]|uniref:protease complex subunit PrcB family protein n=1 Tax=Tenacibaculum sp. P3-BQ1 TaxID=3232310 RepID=UPI0034DEB155